MPSNLAQPAVVFRSARSRACEERAFVLLAVGIASEVEFVGGEVGYEVLVESVVREQALHHLWMYEQERQIPPAPVDDSQPALTGAWRGSLAYVALLLVVPFVFAQGWLSGYPFESGVMSPERIRDGEWWRAITALTLHWDAAHLMGNLIGGALLGLSAAQLWGNARAWLLIAAAAVTANLVEGLLGLSNYVSAGASTAVFAALGLVAAHAWRTRGQRQIEPLRRWAPLIAGIAVLGMFGAGAQDPEAPAADPTNVLSHLLGFVAGATYGALVATRRGARMLEAIPAWLAAVITPAAVLLAWILALHAGE